VFDGLLYINIPISNYFTDVYQNPYTAHCERLLSD